MSELMNITEFSNATVGYFEKCHNGWNGIIVWVCVTVASFAFGFPPGVVILWEMVQRHRKGATFTPNDVFLLNLTIMDMLFLFFMIIEVYNYILGHNIGYERITMFLYSFNMCGKPLFITCICLDCYLAVVHPIIYRTRRSLTPRILVAVGVWAATCAHGSFLALEYETMMIDMFKVSVFAVTLPVIGFCDILILWTLKRSERRGRVLHPQKKKALQIVFNNLVISCVTYVPPLTVYLVLHFLKLTGVTFWCLVAIPSIAVTSAGNPCMSILHLNSLGKLDWIKCWKKK